jgi:hypothetical protein
MKIHDTQNIQSDVFERRLKNDFIVDIMNDVLRVGLFINLP